MFIRVAVDVPLPTLFDYRCPEATSDDIGRRVRVPFGRKRVVGVILALLDQTPIDAAKVRVAGEILRDMPAVPPDVLQVMQFCSDYYHHPIGEVVLSALPSRFRKTPELTDRGRLSVEVTAAGRAALVAGLKRSPSLEQVLARISTARVLSAERVAVLPPSERRALKRLLERGWVSETLSAPDRLIDETSDSVDSTKPELTQEQRASVDAVLEAPPGFKTWLLHGITGSGKTEVYLRAMEAALETNGQVLFLVPEIGLTPQLESRIRIRFAGHELVTLHSNLAAGQRAANWQAAHSGRARIVLGTRSAIFAPLPRLALIVVDEEHDASFKQIEGMKYSARDLAVWRGQKRSIPVILGSATPSLESYQAALSGRYHLLRLSQRANDAPMPRIHMVAVNGPAASNGLANQLLDAIRARLQNREQVLVFINRRGYAPVLVCSACAWAPSCHRCSARLVLHKARSRMVCHHCGYATPVPVACASCGNIDLHPLGYGTQRVETTLRQALPDARILRVDRDTTQSRDAWPQMRNRIEKGEVDVLVGTQLLSKGHDFPGLGLVCVLNADQSLYSTDFRASEQLFAQLTQVAGRAGRGRIPGEVLIQTQFPSHPLYRAVQEHDYDGFARVLLDERAQAGFPPFVHQAVLRAEGTSMEQALNFLRDAAQLAQACAHEVEVFDPAPAVMERLKGRERAQLLVQARARSQLHAFLDRWAQQLASVRAYGARWAIDVDPLSI